MKFSIPGLREPASIKIDRWGIPHIKAQSALDAYLVQGFNAARDRLWQMDLWRKRGLGLLSADFGPGFLEQDKAARLFLYHGNMEREWQAYANLQSREIAQAFVSGINAYIDAIEQGLVSLPAEFIRMGTRPARWQAEDVVRIRTHSLMRNADSELRRALILGGDEKKGAQQDLFRRSINPSRSVKIPGGIDLAQLNGRALDRLKLACANVSFTEERLTCQRADAHLWCAVDDAAYVVPEDDADGSNNWAVAGHLTGTGLPVMATDPHRAFTLPSIRYVVHLEAPGLNVIGMGEPSQPGICIGHNDVAAFSLTMLMMDQEDIYVYRLDPENHDRYEYQGQWESVVWMEDDIPIRDEDPESVRHGFTRHGPVLFVDIKAGLLYALRTVWTEPGSAPYFNSLGLLDVSSVAQYREVLRHWNVPGVNHLYADRDNHIVWQAAGKWPRRTNWDGLLPVPGDGRFEWDGFHTLEDLPALIDPECGYVHSANECKVDDADSIMALRHLSYEWAESSRADRIATVLSGASRHDVESAMQLQGDTWSRPASRVCSILRDMTWSTSESTSDSVRKACALLLNWDACVEVDSPAAALFETWWSKFLRPSVLDHIAGSHPFRELFSPGDIGNILSWLEMDPMLPFPIDARTREALLQSTFEQAVAYCQEKMGSDMSVWKWGDLHQACFVSPLNVGSMPLLPALDRGPVAVGGSASTVMNMAYRMKDFRPTFGASVRMVMNIADWDQSWVINTPGQSGSADSSHYDDLMNVWSHAEYVPLIFSQERIEKETQEIITLLPGAGGD